jgi:tetratricopeptide (TPR) repeat protein
LKRASRGEVAWALNNRGVCKAHLGDLDGAVADYSRVIKLHSVPIEELAKAYLCRGIAKYNLGDRRGAIRDYTATVRYSEAPRRILDIAHWNLEAISPGAARREVGSDPSVDTGIWPISDS